MSTPAVTVLMPVYNAEPHLREAVESILAQTFQDFECLLINDGSTDSTPYILEEYARADSRVRVEHNTENLKIAKTLNKGLALARAPLIARMDADDIATPDRLEKQYVFMQANPDVTVCGSFLTEIASSGKVWDHLPLDNDGIKAGLLFSCCIAHPTTMFRRQEVLELTGGYDPDFPLTEDYDLWCRLAVHERVRFACIPQILLHYRLGHSASNLLRQTRFVQQVCTRYRNELGFSLTADQHRILEEISLEEEPCSRRQKKNGIATLRVMEAHVSEIRTISPEALRYFLRAKASQLEARVVIPAPLAFARYCLPDTMRETFRNIFWKLYDLFLRDVPSVTAARLRYRVLKPFWKRCGADVAIHPKVIFKKHRHISIGNGVFFGKSSRVSALSPVIIGDNVTIGAGVLITTCPGNFIGDNSQIVRIHDDVQIGNRAVIKSGVTIAQGCVIAEGSIVAENTSP